MHQVFRIDKVNGKLATPYTPPQDVEEKVFAVYPPDAADWVREDKIAATADRVQRALRPGLGRRRHCPGIAHALRLRGRAGADHRQRTRRQLQVLPSGFGHGLQPQSFQQIGPEHGNQMSNGLLETWDTTGLDGSANAAAQRG